MIIMRVLLVVVATYLIMGACFGIVFLARGLARVDPAARGSSWAFRLLILPGVAALWPVMAAEWARSPAAHVGDHA